VGMFPWSFKYVFIDSRHNFHLSPISIIEIKQDRGNVPLSCGYE
jgi:hypothetical protein